MTEGVLTQPWLTPARQRALLHGLVIAGWLHLAWHVGNNLSNTWGLGGDALAYWSADLGSLYEGAYGSRAFFPYSPAVALLAVPLGLLPWPVFLAGWIAFNVAIVAWLAGRWTLYALAFPPVIWLLLIGNVEILMAAAVVLGFRYPAAWAFILLTKVTPGIGLLWFAVRREWRNLALALGATAAIVAATWLLLPAQWAAWVDLLASGATRERGLQDVLRLPLAALLVAWGGLTDRRWAVIAAVVLAVPHFWFATLGGLVGLAHATLRK